MEFILVFAAGALVTAVLAALARAGLTAGLEPLGQRLDRWRRVWFHPERELGLLVEAWLILAFVVAIAHRYHVPVWVTPALVGLWALHLPADARSWLRHRRRPRDLRELHRRGFLLLDMGPLWLRVVVVGVAAGLYSLLPPLRFFFDTIMAFILTSLEGWFS